MWHVGLVTLALTPVLVAAGAASAADWSVRSVARADAPGVRCRLESSRQTLPDGYQNTTAYIVVAAKSVTVITAAPLDASFKDIGLAVDQGEFIPMDGLDGDKTVLFDSNYDRLVGQFKAGLKARVQVRFWPTWPATRAQSTTFSLIGFTNAYDQLPECR